MFNKKIIIDAINKEETRIAFVSNGILEEYDFEVSSKEEVKGNIYLAKVTRVESSLQAVFVEYSRDRQGFLPFNEISIDYFNLPLEVKEKLKQEYHDLKLKRKKAKENSHKTKTILSSSENTVDIQSTEDTPNNKEESVDKPSSNENNNNDYLDQNINNLIQNTNSNDYFMNLTKSATQAKKEDFSPNESPNFNEESPKQEILEESTFTETITTDEDDNTEDYSEDKLSKEYLDYGTRFGYKIQDVIAKNQYILVQVVKDERGNKGASLTTYLSIPGRYCVFMPNSPALEGGISKKIVDAKERNRLKNILNNIDISKDSNLIIRTAGVNKTQEEIEQDYSYILKLWDNIKNQASNANEPLLIYEEASLIKKILRDSQFDEIHVNNKNTYHNMVEFAKLISPETIKKIKLFPGKREMIFNHFNIEEQVKSIYSPIVFLKSGGYLVIHPTEALTAIDINSGKFKGNKNVEETALKNNLEAAKEIAKQIKLRNLGGLIVIDFIDMENPKNRIAVEKKLKDEVKNDKAKIQIGQISSFGLLEMARQHVKSSLFEKSFLICPKCQGMGYRKPLELNALQILRDIKTDITKISSSAGKNYKIKLPSKEAFFILNNKRHTLNSLEEYLDINIIIECDDNIPYPFYDIKEDNTDNSKTKNSTVLLLETEIANNLKNLKNNDKIKNNNFKHKPKHYKSKEHQPYKKNNHNKNNYKTKTNNTTKIPSKSSWLKRLFKKM